MPYTNFIGMFAEEEEAMQDDLSRLRKLGYSPYFIKTQNGRYKLVVGAFITKQGAENQSKELQSKGIQNKVIKR
jgi:cell division septation protein DedD